MRIFIDEAGNFVPPANAQSLFSLVLALEKDYFEFFPLQALRSETAQAA